MKRRVRVAFYIHSPGFSMENYFKVTSSEAGGKMGGDYICPSKK
jgi:hypothetical protein